MPRPKEHKYDDRIRELAAAGHRPPAIVKALEQEAARLGLNDTPTESTVRRRVKEFAELSPQQKRQYALFRWPDSIENGDLPWEASGLLLDLLGHLDADGVDRPTVREAVWFWRVCLATPNLDRLHEEIFYEEQIDLFANSVVAVSNKSWEEFEQWQVLTTKSGRKHVFDRISGVQKSVCILRYRIAGLFANRYELEFFLKNKPEPYEEVPDLPHHLPAVYDPRRRNLGRVSLGMMPPRRFGERRDERPRPTRPASDYEERSEFGPLEEALMKLSYVRTLDELEEIRSHPALNMETFRQEQIQANRRDLARKKKAQEENQ